jgi:predicted phosphodiesterase
MTIAIIADIHGNADALSAVLQDVTNHGGADEVLVLGDIVAEGPDSVEVVERLGAMSIVRCVRGNTDRWVTEGVTDPPPRRYRDDEHLLRWAELSRVCGWTAGALAQRGLLDWLITLPTEQRLTLPDGSTLVAVHGSPLSDELPIGPATSPHEMQHRLQGCSANIVCAGHTHRAWSGRCEHCELYTVRSVSNPVGKDKSAGYAIIQATSEGHAIEMRNVAYDFQPALGRAREARHPCAEMLRRAFACE